ncbi:MAG: pyruvate kinase [Ilumatobacteraceae bacterium]
MNGSPAACLREVEDLRATVLAATPDAAVLATVHDAHRQSATNLAQFIALRSHDLRQLQHDLASLGLSSLGRSEANVAATLDAVHRALLALNGNPVVDPEDTDHSFEAGPRALQRKTHALLGPRPPHRTTRIMVTMPTEAAFDRSLVHRFVDAGMDVARINCAHDTPAEWHAIATNVRAAAQRADKDVRILMDLAGPKLRTASMAPGAAVVRIKPRRDLLGKVITPGRALLVAEGSLLDDPNSPMQTIPVSVELWDVLRPGMKLRLTDSRNAQRTLLVRDVGMSSAVVECERTAYVTPGMSLQVEHPSGTSGVVGEFPPTEGWVQLTVGHIVELIGGDVQGEPLTPGRVRVGCTLPEAVAALRPGHRVFFDDGKFEGVVETVRHGRHGPPNASIRITAAPEGGGKLRAEKGINLPDTDVEVPALTERDLQHLAIATDLADLVALSFVREPVDVDHLLRAIDDLGARRLGIVLKIETVQGFRNLPQILQTAMRTERVGVMIARGDLAVEVGYERLAEVQEEILWLCEAAHLPVIWATEVLDQLARTGRPSRSEITDAAMSERAECVMLNKGPHIVDAISTLREILQRMAEHQSKKRHLMRPLRSWTGGRPG